MERANLMRQGLQGTSFIPLPLQEPGAINFSFFGEVLAGRDFGGRNIYCEYHVEADREVWRAEEGFGDRLAGASPAARAVAYPQAWGLGQRAHAVAHWCFPIELAMVAAQRPKPSQWPVLHFHVASIDGWERHRTEGYGSLLLGQHGPGQRVQYIPTWRPAGTVFSWMAEFYVGGAHALKDITYAWNNSEQAGSARLLSKYGFQAESSGTIKVRTNMVYQERPDALQAVAPEGRVFSTDEIIQRARRRIQEKPAPAVDPPTIVQQPRAVQTLPGETVTLAVEARGALPLRYQWSFNGRELPGATRDKLVLPAVEDSVTGAYQCRVTGPAGSVLTDEVDVHILTATTIVEHPRSQAAAAGDVAVFTVVVGGEPPIRYQWTHNGEAIPDARESTLRVGPVARTDAGFYSCMASGPSGTALSNQAELTILKKTGIVRHPRPMQVFIGEPAEFAVEADGAPPLRFQWSKDGVDVPGSTAATLRIASSREEDTGVYACRVTGQNGAAASAGAELQILTKVTILTQPVSQNVAAGAPAEFSIKARSGNREPMYQWSKNGEKIPGASASVYRIRAAAGRDEGIYTCRVTGTAASVLSDEAELILLSGTSITRHPESLALAEGATAAFRVAAQGTGDLAYQWSHNGKEIAGATQAAYSVPASPAAAGTYTCTVTSGAGKAFSNDAELTLLARQGPTIVAQPQDAERERGQSASFSVKAVGDGPLGYEWKKGDAVLSEPGPEITVDDVQEGFTVTCTVTNAHGEAVSRAALLRIVTTDIFELLEAHEKANQTRMFDLFRQFDKDGSGQLDIDELAALVRTVHPGVTPAQLRHFQILIDADGDGRLSYKEMVMGVKECKQVGIRSGEGVTEEDAFETLLQKVGQVLAENNARAYEIFEALDADDSGRLGPREVRTLFKRLLPGLAKKELRALLVRLYASGGVEFGVELEYEQFRTWMVQRETGEVRSELTRRSGLRTTPREAADQARLIG